jgi:hypothetical protein
MMKLNLSIYRVTWNDPEPGLSAYAHRLFKKTTKRNTDTPNWVFKNVGFDNNLRLSYYKCEKRVNFWKR